MHKEKLKKKNSEIPDEKKMITATAENNLIDAIKILLSEFSLSWKFMCAGENNDKNKTNLPPAPFTLVRISVCFY